MKTIDIKLGRSKVQDSNLTLGVGPQGGIVLIYEETAVGNDSNLLLFVVLIIVIMPFLVFLMKRRTFFVSALSYLRKDR